MAGTVPTDGAQPPVHLVTGEEAIERHAPFDWRMRYGIDAADELLESGSTHPHSVSVFTVDIRRSTSLALETDPLVFARIMKEFIDFSWVAVRSLGGWFDKFTGDGFLAYRPHGSHLDGAWEPPPAGGPPPTLAGLIFLADHVARYFDENVRPLLRRSARNWPQDAGLAIGLDAGRCHQMLIGDDITLFGPAIVGAVRMVQCAKAGEMIVNLGLGQRLSDQIDQGVWGDMLEIGLTTRHSKEYPESVGGQEVYLLNVLDPKQVLDASGEDLAQVRSILARLPYDPTDGRTLQRV